MTSKDTQSPVIFGEVLFDRFPDGRSVLGGAPFNVAWHLQGFGIQPLMVTGIGKDDLGAEVMQSMQSWGMNVDGVQIHNRYPTGQVTVEFSNGQPQYNILMDQAYDHLDQKQLKTLLSGQKIPLIYHGSLALRTSHTRSAFNDLHEFLNAPVFLDLNLRDPWWTKMHVDTFLKRAHWVKMNDEELREISAGRATHDDLRQLAAELRDRYDLAWLIVTMGEKGAFVISQSGITEGEAVQVENIVDTVGAGDAFSAVTIRGILQGWPLQKILDVALSFAAQICTQQGATSENVSLYTQID